MKSKNEAAEQQAEGWDCVLAVPAPGDAEKVLKPAREICGK